MRWTILGAVALSCGLAACATGGSGGREVKAVVEDEQARQAVATAVWHGEDPQSALKQGAAAASKETVPTEPPTP